MADMQGQELLQHLRNTTSPRPGERAAAEQYLREHETQPQFAPTMLHVVGSAQLDGSVRQAAAIFFKNFVNRNWSNDGDRGLISAADRNAVKQGIVELMTLVPGLVQKQVSQAITIIAQHDFYHEWEQLLPDLVKRLEGGNFAAMNGLLAIVESIVARYQGHEKDEKMVDEIKYIMGMFAGKWLLLLQQLTRALMAPLALDVVSPPALSDADREALRYQVACVRTLVTIFWHLINVDLIEWFEEQMPQWAPVLQQLLKLHDKFSLFAATHDVEAMQTAVVKVMTLFNSRYEEEYRAHVATFVDLTAQLLDRVSEDERYDALVAEAVGYLSSVARQHWHRDLFSKVDTLNAIVSRILVRNIMLRESDVHMYEMEPEDYVQRDMEGSDLYTRRRGAIELVRGLCEHFEREVTDIILQQIKKMMVEYQRAPEQHFREKDAAITLVLAVAVKGSTTSGGATILNDKVPVEQFFNEHVKGELSSPAGTHPVVKADCLKFVVLFRSQWPQDVFEQLVPLALQFLTVDDYVLHTYAAIAIDRVLAMKVKQSPASHLEHRFPTDKVVQHQRAMLTNLFQVLAKFEDSACNEHVMKAILRVCRRSEARLEPVVADVLNAVQPILMRVAKNPSQATFNHYLFELLACMIYNVARPQPRLVEEFERCLSPTLLQMLDMESCFEFHPYVYQLLGLMLRMRGQVTDAYVGLLDRLLRRELWQTDGNIVAISGMFAVFLRLLRQQGEQPLNQVLSEKRLTGMLGIFQFLLSKRTQDFHAFKVLRALFAYAPLQRIGPHLAEVFRIVFRRLTQHKSALLCSSFIANLALFAAQHGWDTTLRALDQVQPGVFTMVVDSVWLPFGKNVMLLEDRKLLTVATTALLVAPQLHQPQSALMKFLPDLFKLVIQVFEVDPEQPPTDPHTYLERLETQGAGAKFSGLAFAREKPIDWLAEVKDPREHFARTLAGAFGHKAQLGIAVADRVPDKYVKAFNGYCEKFGVQYRMPQGRGMH